MQTKAKILMLDVETAPQEALTWGMFKQNISVEQIKHRGYMLCYRAKWLGEYKLLGDAIWKHRNPFKMNPRCDKTIATSLWKLLDEADIVVAHNGRRFDVQWAYYLFIKHGLGPCSPFKQVDTLEAARTFRFVSKKLENIAIELFKDHKMETGGMSLWIKTMAGVAKFCKRMYDYCGQDVLLLERAYLAFRPYMKAHPNVNLYGDIDIPRCPVCGSDKLRNKGRTPLGKSVFKRYKCTSCSHPFRLGGNLLTKAQRAMIGVSIK